jgi:hypothetical protein
VPPRPRERSSSNAPSAAMSTSVCPDPSGQAGRQGATVCLLLGPLGSRQCTPPGIVYEPGGIIVAIHPTAPCGPAGTSCSECTGHCQTCGSPWEGAAAAGHLPDRPSSCRTFFVPAAAPAAELADRLGRHLLKGAQSPLCRYQYQASDCSPPPAARCFTGRYDAAAALLKGRSQVAAMQPHAPCVHFAGP